MHTLSIIIILSCASCDTPNIKKNMPQERIISIEELNNELEINTVCHIEKIEKIPHTNKFLITRR